jgi:hypothetical protein
MALHMIKLCVGIDDPAQLARVQAARLFRKGGTAMVPGWTRRAPVRTEELLAGGSLYWVVKGQVRCRQRFLGFEADTDDGGAPFCRMLLDPDLVPTLPVARKPFQGWRYLKASEAPPDLDATGTGAADMPPALAAELRSLGLL